MAKIYNLTDFIGGCKMSEVSIYDVAQYFLNIEPMTHKKLQKICYYTQAWHLAFYKVRLFNSTFEAWVHGPVCPELYDKYKVYGWNIISSTHESADSIESNKYLDEFLMSVYNTYYKFSGDQLETLSHNEDPWKQARKGLEEWEPSHNNIDENLMRDFYWGIYEKSQRV